MKLVFEPASSTDLKSREDELKRLIIKAAINRATGSAHAERGTDPSSQTGPGGQLG